MYWIVANYILVVDCNCSFLNNQPALADDRPDLPGLWPAGDVKES